MKASRPSLKQALASIAAFCLLTAPFLSAKPTIQVFETSRSGHHYDLVDLDPDANVSYPTSIVIDTTNPKQTVVGFGSSFTESTAYVLSQLSPEKRAEVLAASFSKEGAGFSLTRTHIASCDFSLSNYTYAEDPESNLEDFTIAADEPDLIPLIKDAMAEDGADFKIIASPWTAPIWMKDNHEWNAGSLLTEHYSTFARYTVKYLEAYNEIGIPIWGITPENEPLGNGGQWESLHFTSDQMAAYIGKDLGPKLKEADLDTRIFIFDQNRDNAVDYIAPILADPIARPFIDGIALHWYSTTNDYCPEVLDEITSRFPDMPFFHSEGCIDVMGDDEPAGVWLQDDWYWSKEATDWGYYWAEGDAKKDHPVYRPFYRYARDIIGGLNHGFFGWIDWNLALDFKGGPNHANNFACAPILVDAATDTVYFNPIFYCLKHFSKAIRPGAQILPVTGQKTESLMATAALNPDGSLVIVAFNMEEFPQVVSYQIGGHLISDTLIAQSLKTYIIQP